jgi:nucleoside-diphosphate-sugar epimerase
MNICFIGSNGFVAKTFGAYLANDHQITVLGRTQPTYTCHTFLETDLLSNVFDFERLASFDLIFYFAGEGVQAAAKPSANALYEINTFVPIKLILGLEGVGYKGKIITFGSYAEIGSTNSKKAFDEKQILLSQLPIPNNYTISKRLLSRFIDTYKYEHVQLYHFILPTVYGKGENTNRLIPYLINCHLEGKKSMLTSGTQVRHYLHIAELPDMIMRALKTDTPGIYNVAGPDIYSVKQIAAMVAKEFKIPKSNIMFSSTNRWDTSMQSLVLNGSKLELLIDYRAQARLSTTIKSYI